MGVYLEYTGRLLGVKHSIMVDYRGRVEYTGRLLGVYVKSIQTKWRIYSGELL